MLKPQFLLPLAHELVIDLFAGGGGASTGIEQAIGRHVDIAVNHDPQAVALHQANHPQTLHFVSDVFEVDPIAVADGRPVGLLWASPDCKHFSKAKGAKPVSKKIRGLAWVMVKWARLVRPRIIFFENVEEFQDWGPLVDDRPCPKRKGATFKRWKAQFENLGYRGEFREIRASTLNTPTIRKRLYGIFRCDGQPIVWPEPTNGPGLKPYRTAAECIDWHLPCPSIFERAKPLAEATQRRIAHGIKRYVIDAAKPFIVPVTHPGDARVHSIDEPFRTVTGANRGELALAAPTIARIGQTGGAGKYANSAQEPLTTITSKAEHLLVAPALIDAAHADVSPGGVKRWGKGHRAIDGPVQTITGSGGNAALCAAFLAKHYGGVVGSAMRDPMATVTSVDHHSLVTSKLETINGSTRRAEGADCSRVDGGPRGRDHLETGEARLSAARQADHPEESGETVEGRLPDREDGLARGAVPDRGARCSALDSEGAGAGGVGRQSRGWSEVEQPPEELGADDAGEERGARMAHRASKAFPWPDHRNDVAALLLKYYSTDQDPRIEEPLHTVTTKDRFGLVTVKGEDYFIADIGMRMLQPRELYRAQGFPDSYVIDRGADGRALPKDAQVRMCGNSVCPPVAAALVRANYAEAAQRRAA